MAATVPVVVLREGLEALAIGDFARARAVALAVLHAAPGDPGALHLLGLAALRAGDALSAAAALSRAARADKRNPDVHVNLGLARLETGDSPGAVTAFRRALALAPARVDAHRGLGDALAAAGRTRDAAAEYERAIRLAPRDGASLHNLGLVLRADGRLDEAADAFRGAAQCLADPHASLVNLGAILEECGRGADAIGILEKVAMRADAPAMALVSYGNALVGGRRYADAEAAFRRAHAVEPARAEPLNNLGGLLKMVGRFDEALECFDGAVRAAPDHATARVNRALALLARGRLGEAWPDYEWRVKARAGADYLADPSNPARTLPRPSSLPAGALIGKRLLVLRDQGIGDELFFLRFAPRLRARGTHIAYQPSERIASLVARAGCVDEVVSARPPRDAYDFAIGVAELPLAVGAASFADVPPPLALEAELARIADARPLLAGGGPILGVTWRAGMERRFGEIGSLRKEIAPEALGTALRGWPGRVVVLQRAPRPGEIARFEAAIGRDAVDLSHANDDLEMMLGALACLDEYAGPSNTNTHLFHGLGRAAHVLVPNPPEWRWLERGDVSPWFPGARLYRQAPGEEWLPVLEELGEALAAPLR